MPQPRKSLTELANSGTLQKNLGRYQSRIAAEGATIRPIGKAPTHFTPVQRAIWAEVVRSAPDGVLQRPDRIALEVLCRMVTRMRFMESKSSDLNALVNVLAKMGLTPSDRTKLNIEPPAIPSEFSEWDALDELD